MKKVLCRLLFRIFGWKMRGDIPSMKKYIVITAPHTSNWDFFIGRCFAYIHDIKAKYLLKSELYFWPLNILIKLNGGIPVYRKKAKNMVEQIVQKFNSSENLILAISPEGTRSRVNVWKTGFYHIAFKAKVPIVLSYIDYKKKEIGYFGILEPSGDLDKDLKYIQGLYKNVVGKRPDLYNDKIY